MKYDSLYGLSAASYRYPGEENAFAKIEKVPLLDKLADAYVRLIMELYALPDVDGNCFRVTEKTSPRLYKLYELAAMRLDMDSIPALYLKSSYEINAGSYGGSKPLIVVNSSIAEGMKDEEVLFILGHELGHTKGRHVTYNNMLHSLSFLLSKVPEFGDELELGFALGLLNWKRMQEYSADRAGLIACANPDAAVKSIASVMGASDALPGINITTEDILLQAENYDEELQHFVSQVYSAIMILESDHPWTILRARELHKWNASGEYRALVEKHMNPSAAFLLK